MINMLNWKTSLGGFAAILSGTGAAINALTNGDTATLYAAIPGILAGVGLIAAKDKNVSGGTISAIDGTDRAKPVSMIRSLLLTNLEQVKELLHYNPDTGVFRWRVARRQMRPGDVAGLLFAGGYRNIKIDRRFYKEHRLAWLYMTGEWPVAGIDHVKLNGTTIDGVI